MRDDATPTCSQRFWNISFSFCVINFHRLLQRTIRSVLGTSFMFTISSAQYREYPFLPQEQMTFNLLCLPSVRSVSIVSVSRS